MHIFFQKPCETIDTVIARKIKAFFSEYLIQKPRWYAIVILLILKYITGFFFQRNYKI